MSGGVDSAVAALLVSRSGAECAGITMRLWEDSKKLPDALDVAPDFNCAEAKAICDTLGIPHYSVSLGESFCTGVVDHFSAEYVAGRTPNPCVECNKKIKFGKLFDVAGHYGASKLATGHYARIRRDTSGNFMLCRKARKCSNKL